MNVKSLIINNKAVVKTDEFRSIAVTAHKWLPIHEVRVPHLLDYLKF